MIICKYKTKIRHVVSNEKTLDITMIGTLVWGGRKTGTEITGCTHDRDDRQVLDRIVETGGRCYLVAYSRIGCSRLIVAPAGMPVEDCWQAAQYQSLQK